MQKTCFIVFSDFGLQFLRWGCCDGRGLLSLPPLNSTQNVALTRSAKTFHVFWQKVSRYGRYVEHGVDYVATVPFGVDFVIECRPEQECPPLKLEPILEKRNPLRMVSRNSESTNQQISKS